MDEPRDGRECYAQVVKLIRGRNYSLPHARCAGFRFFPVWQERIAPWLHRIERLLPSTLYGSSSTDAGLDTGSWSHLWELRMRTSPSTVPKAGHDTYLVLDDLGRFGCVWRETADQDANHDALIHDLLDDQFSRPARVVAFNTSEGWSRDVTADIADELRRRFAEYDEVPVSVQEFLEMARR